MNRRQFVVGIATIAACSGVAPAGRAECGEPTANEFVGEFYHKQARLHAARAPLQDDAFHALFAGELRELMQAPRRHAKDTPLGPLLHAFFGPGVLPGTEVNIDRIALSSGKLEGPATVEVTASYRGESHLILVQAVREHGVWLIANVIYDSGKSLLTHYRSMSAHRRWRLTSLRALRLA